MFAHSNVWSRLWQRGVCFILALVCTIGLWPLTRAVIAQVPGGTPPQDVILKIGVVQRFGARSRDRLVVQAPTGDQLTVKFKRGDRLEQITTAQVQIGVQMQPLNPPQLEERVVFGNYRSFESAEYTGNQWRRQGIAVELAQPSRWQVWAKREVYNTPLLRRMLLESVQRQGGKVNLESRVIRQVARAVLLANGVQSMPDEVEISSGKNVLRVQQETDESQQRVYPGKLRLQPNAYGNYTLVNDVPLEQYLRGVVPHEIGLSAPAAAIQAQAVLARTYALRNLRRFAVDNYELCADTQCQVYWGIGGAAPASDRAISSTRGLVLVYNNELVDALYSSTTGGVTAPFEDVWKGEGRPYLRAVIDSVENVWDLNQRSLANEANFRAFIKLTKGFNEVGWDPFRWREEEDLDETNVFLRRYLKSIDSPFAEFNTIRKLEITERAASGRVQKIRVTTDRHVFEIAKDDILNAFYPPSSLLFYIQPVYNPDKTLRGHFFIGGGFGHGVGLSQTGSYNLGELGWSYDRILRFYFPGTQLKPISQAIVFWSDPMAGKP